MIRALLTFAINVVLSAVGLLIAANVATGVTLQWSGFVIAVLIFAAAQAILSPFVWNMARKYASAVLGGIGIVSTLLALWVATLLSGGGLTISGLGAWVRTALIVWLVTALGGWFLGWLVIRRWWDRRQEAKKVNAAAARLATPPSGPPA
ncbi:MAG: phage holin family protein [Micropruina sp.]|nr:phage holin family protein [Micropruina sp.]